MTTIREDVIRQRHSYVQLPFVSGTAQPVFDASVNEVALALASSSTAIGLVHATAEPREAPSANLRDAIRRRRAQAAINELVRLGVSRERLVEQDEREFLLARKDLPERELRAILDSASVLIYGPTPHVAPTSIPASEPCLPGAKTWLRIAAAELVQGHAAVLGLRVCLDDHCARAKLSLGTFGVGDEFVMQLDGEPRTGASIAWTGSAVSIGVRTMVDDQQIHDGSTYEVSVDINGRQVRSLNERIHFAHADSEPNACRIVEYSVL